MSGTLILLAISCLISTFFLTQIFYRFVAGKKIFLDIPSVRSAHTIPKLKCGGIAIVIVYSLAVLLCTTNGLISNQNCVGYLVGGLLIAVVSFFDDLFCLSVKFRLAMHFCAAVIVLLSSSDYAVLSWQFIFYTLLIVWVTNLYNFMDGIDSLVVLQTILFAVGFGVFAAIVGMTNMVYLSTILAASALGFSYFNFPPAKLFMGDVGSCFLGFNVASFLVLADGNQLLNFSIWAVLLAYFLVDSGATLLLRLLKRERFWESHACHLYQKYAKRKGVKRTLCMFLLLLLGLILPLSLFCYIFDVFSYNSLVWLALIFLTLLFGYYRILLLLETPPAANRR